MSGAALLATDMAGICPLLAPAAVVVHGIVSQAVLTAPGLRVTRFRFSAGQELSEHASPSRVLVQVLMGKVEFALPAQVVRLQAGDLLHLPPKLSHSVRALEEVTLLITQATPPGPN